MSVLEKSENPMKFLLRFSRVIFPLWSFVMQITLTRNKPNENHEESWMTLHIMKTIPSTKKGEGNLVPFSVENCHRSVWVTLAVF